jgi:hypothetical protein
MFRRLAYVLAFSLVACVPGLSLAASAKPKTQPRTSRIVTMPYRAGCAVTADSPIGAIGHAMDESTCGAVGGGGTVDTAHGERYMSVEATDAAGQPVGVEVFETGQYTDVADYCGNAKSIRVSPNSTYDVYAEVYLGGCTAGPPTAGTIRITLSNQP